jgi:hypothetical protein
VNILLNFIIALIVQAIIFLMSKNFTESPNYPSSSTSGSGSLTAEAIRSIGVTEVTYYRWRSEYGGLKGDQVKRLSVQTRM